jgi:hypothetical protein
MAKNKWTLTAAGREKIRRAQKRRWAEYRRVMAEAELAGITRKKAKKRAA